mmetsp:Transcript_24062/g.44705  ORF Transcript_24062/g.44705 Transcript_24062/m.44705 type:complete len:411 (+) Transcript_24062:204-1436(+)
MKFMASALLSLLAVAVSIETSSAFTIAPRHAARHVATPTSSRSISRPVALSDPSTDLAAGADDSDDEQQVELEPAVAVDAAADITMEETTTSFVEGAEDAAADAVVEEEEEEEHKIYVGNFPFSTSQDDIRELFQDKVAITSLSMPTNPQRVDEETGMPLSKGFAFVSVESEEDVERAVEALDGAEVGGRTIRVNKLLPKDQVPNRNRNDRKFVAEGKKKLYVGNVPFDSTPEDLRDLFEEFGDVSDVYIPLRDGRARGFAFVTMEEDKADLAMKETNGLEFMGRRLVVNEPLGKGEKNAVRRTNNNSQFKIYVGNLSFYTTRETLQGVFEEFGEVYDCYIPVDVDTDKPRGFAFVTMDRESGEQAIAELDDLELDGRFIRVNEAQGKRKPAATIRDEEDGFYSNSGGFY